MAAIKYMPTKCDEIYNIGSGVRTTIDKVVQILESMLEKTAVTVSDVITTSLGVMQSFFKKILIISFTGSNSTSCL